MRQRRHSAGDTQHAWESTTGLPVRTWSRLPTMPSATCRKPGSGRDDEFPGGASGLHRGVRLNNLIEVVDAVDRYDGFAGGDAVEEFLQHRLGQVFGLAVV